MDWKDCTAVESKPDIHNGAPVVRGTRLTVEDSILGNLEAGVPEDELPMLFPVLKGKQRELRDIISFARKRMYVPNLV